MKNFFQKKPDKKKPKIYISPLTIALLIVTALCRNLWPTLIAYLIGLVHECAHVAAGSLLKIQTDGISIMPFGLSIHLKEGHIKDPRKEFWVCFAGPASNVLMFCIAIALDRRFNLHNSYLDFFISCNLMMFFLNILPILPLDGGRMLKSALTDEWGLIKAVNFTQKAGIAALIVFAAAMIGSFLLHQWDISWLIMFCFLIYSLLSERQKNDLFLMRELMCADDKMKSGRIMKIKNIAATPDASAIKILEKLSYHTYTIVDVIGDDKGKKASLTETQLIRGVTELGAQAKVSDIFRICS